MDVKLFKKLVVLHEGTKDEKKFYTFYLKLANGETLKVLPNSYVDKNKKTQSNYRELCLIANDELPFDK